MSEQLSAARTLRVLSIDGGGMRGIYSAAYLSSLLKSFGKIRQGEIDLGAAFDLICGTSTGAIIACALAAKIQMDKVAALYREHGKEIFPKKVPGGFFDAVVQLKTRPGLNKAGDAALKKALSAVLENKTIGDVWTKRQIGLAIPAVEMSRHRSWVFKTPHLENSKDRDGEYTLVDACMATSAAPVFRSLARVPGPHNEGSLVFTDGGLWANTPLLVGLIDALEMTKAGDRIELFCLSTCPPPSGDEVAVGDEHWGLLEWKMGGKVPAVAISAQQYAFFNMARMIGKHTCRDVHIVPFPHGPVQPSLFQHVDLDETSDAALAALLAQAETDASQALSVCGDANSDDGFAIDQLFRSAPLSKDTPDV